MTLEQDKSKYLHDAGQDGYDNGTATKDRPQGENTTISSVSGDHFSANPGTADWVTARAIDRHIQDINGINHAQSGIGTLLQTFDADQKNDSGLANKLTAYNIADNTLDKTYWEHLFEYDASRFSHENIDTIDAAIGVKNSFSAKLPTDQSSLDTDNTQIKNDEKGWHPTADVTNLLIEEAQASNASTDNKTDDGNALLNKARQVANDEGDQKAAQGFKNADDADSYIQASIENLKPYGQDSTNVSDAATQLSKDQTQAKNDIEAAKAKLNEDENRNVAPDLDLTRKGFDKRYSHLQSFMSQLQNDMHTYGQDVDPNIPQSIPNGYDDSKVQDFSHGKMAGQVSGEQALMEQSLAEAYPVSAKFDVDPNIPDLEVPDFKEALSASDASQLQKNIDSYKQGNHSPELTREIANEESIARNNILTDTNKYNLYHEAVEDYSKLDYEAFIFGNGDIENKIGMDDSGAYSGSPFKHPDEQTEKQIAEKLIADTDYLNRLLTGTDKGFVMHGAEWSGSDGADPQYNMYSNNADIGEADKEEKQLFIINADKKNLNALFDASNPKSDLSKVHEDMEVLSSASAQQKKDENIVNSLKSYDDAYRNAPIVSQQQKDQNKFTQDVGNKLDKSPRSFNEAVTDLETYIRGQGGNRINFSQLNHDFNALDREQVTYNNDKSASDILNKDFNNWNNTPINETAKQRDLYV